MDKSEPPRKKKYFCTFLDKWLKMEEYKDWLQKVETHTANCRICNVKFTVKHDGEKALSTHLESLAHKKNAKTIQTNQLMTTFMTVKGKIHSLLSSTKILYTRLNK